MELFHNLSFSFVHNGQTLLSTWVVYIPIRPLISLWLKCLWFATSLYLVLNHCWLVLGYLMRVTQQQMISVRWNGLIALFQWNLYSAASGKHCLGWFIYHLLLVLVSECQFLTVYTLNWDGLLFIICKVAREHLRFSELASRISQSAFARHHSG